MGMKPRLNDGPVDMPGLVNQPKKVDEKTPLPENLVNHAKAESGPLHDPTLASCSKGN